ncbi:hypothetical protein L3556_13445 [Candidatus Synechococcus calcipolaris G9]|uniref:Transferase n=1 Tax=Candidatus Synechococcus calcipolaris G9 TaxID=1497997 RepID=A0ABT6F268_9SYNE|nr:hypothetical protein [Candidatus Synechococcus calcipolaris]MDG2991928.1 hypothetical protein [Candidatus Synechococcus calcipolaris G9]
MIGDVIVHPQAVLGAGVLLWAEEGSRIRIGPGVCIGMGCILHGRDGCLEIGEGANLGAGVLIMGSTTVGYQACIGAGTTILAGAIAPGAVISPGSLIGDTSRPAPAQPKPTEAAPTQKISATSETYVYSHKTETIPNQTTDPWLSQEQSVPESSTESFSPPINQPHQTNSSHTPPDQVKEVNPTEIPTPAQVGLAEIGSGDSHPPPSEITTTSKDDHLTRPNEPKTIYGQAYVNRMMTKMFHYRGQS